MEYAVLFLPLVGSLVGYLGRSLTKYFAEISTSLFVCVSAGLSIFIFWNGIHNDVYGNYVIFEWISSGGFVANWSINIDPLSSVMLVVVTFVSALVHIYSIGYMSHDPHKPRFMSYLSLFTFSNVRFSCFRQFFATFFWLGGCWFMFLFANWFLV